MYKVATAAILIQIRGVQSVFSLEKHTVGWNMSNGSLNIQTIKYYSAGLRRNFISICFCWFSFTMGYFGLFYNTPAKQGNVYLVFITPVLFSPIACVLSPLLQRKLGRKACLFGGMIIAGIMMMSTLAVPSKMVRDNPDLVALSKLRSNIRSLTHAQN